MKGMALASPVTAAGGNLFKQACSMQKAGDVVISPISVVVAMSMAAAGATDGHKSGKEIRTAMKHGLVLKGSDEASVHAYFKDLLNGMHQSDKRVRKNNSPPPLAPQSPLSPPSCTCLSSRLCQVSLTKKRRSCSAFHTTQLPHPHSILHSSHIHIPSARKPHLP